ncbi:unnamed protein product [Cyprideis torosa]|uniref:Uncharacterized protein n=1 Tax=Cyprideis torosa TaxID=163714 RepID=A0A7R8WT09_9CRUS|nr:unnamed protein product [Cyprideis torosa]CAG0908075.1 unnamed protein product [Cyprideis torosa]
MTEMIMLDEIRTHKLVQMQREAASYVRRNRWKVEEAVRIITREKSVKRKTWETINDVVQKFGLRAINLHSYLGIINMIRSPKIQGPTYKPTA